MELTLRIDTKSKRGKILLEYILRLAKVDDSISVVSDEDTLIKEIEEGLEEVKKHKEGKSELKTLDHLLNEL